MSFCHREGSRTFTLRELNDYGDYRSIGIGGQTPEATVRRLLQELRDEGFIGFNNKRGCYTLLGQAILENESVDDSLVIKTKNKDMKEILMEIYVRNSIWVKKAKEALGLFCLYPKCKNTFLKEDGTPYIEVHHIIPLHQNGEDAIWNLSVLCAHHHRMAHFADVRTKIEIAKQLTDETQRRI